MPQQSERKVSQKQERAIDGRNDGSRIHRTGICPQRQALIASQPEPHVNTLHLTCSSSLFRPSILLPSPSLDDIETRQMPSLPPSTAAVPVNAPDARQPFRIMAPVPRSSHVKV